LRGLSRGCRCLALGWVDVDQLPAGAGVKAGQARVD
jgi:hypothetical protein